MLDLHRRWSEREDLTDAEQDGPAVAAQTVINRYELADEVTAFLFDEHGEETGVSSPDAIVEAIERVGAHDRVYGEGLR